MVINCKHYDTLYKNYGYVTNQILICIIVILIEVTCKKQAFIEKIMSFISTSLKLTNNLRLSKFTINDNT